MALYFISSINLSSFLQSLSKESAAYGLAPEQDDLLWKRMSFDEIPQAVIGRYRAIQPLKQFVFPVKEEVTGEPADRKTLVVGAKACDLGHLMTTDSMFIGGVLIDPYYGVKRQNTAVISSDCDAVKSSCFCTLMGVKPYPEKGFDVNLSPVSSGFIAETGTDKGEEMVASRKNLFEEPREDQLKEREALRAGMVQKVNDNNRQYTWKDPKAVVEGHFDSPLWYEEDAKTCVECDACRFTCGTCYCFLLSETKNLWEKLRTWDSCQSAGYWRVAGGASPRKTRTSRRRNFLMCKLSFRPKNFNFYACTGCGRCADVCQGKIDIRKTLQKLHEEKKEQ